LVLTSCHPSIVAGLEAAPAPALDIEDLTRRMSAGDELAYRKFYDAYFQRRSVRELAEAFQTSEKAIESRLVRIRRKLKEALLLKLKNE
jgi:DNA-directed RNA polymerase specialized sigma24 family protein